VLGDFVMKIKDIIGEGFMSGFAKGFLGGLKPKVFQDIEQAQQSGLQSLPPNIKDTAILAYKKFGDNPESDYPGAAGWIPPDAFGPMVNAQATALGKDPEPPPKPKTKQRLRSLFQPEPTTASEPSDDSSLSIPQGQRIAVMNPQKNATFYKYSDGRWTDEYGQVMPTASHGALNKFADTAGRMEPIPSKKSISGFRPRRGVKGGA